MKRHDRHSLRDGRCFSSAPLLISFFLPKHLRDVRIYVACAYAAEHMSAFPMITTKKNANCRTRISSFLHFVGSRKRRWRRYAELRPARFRVSFFPCKYFVYMFCFPLRDEKGKNGRSRTSRGLFCLSCAQCRRTRLRSQKAPHTWRWVRVDGCLLRKSPNLPSDKQAKIFEVTALKGWKETRSTFCVFYTIRKRK